MTRAVISIHRASDAMVVADRVAVADRFWPRLKGLLSERSLTTGEGLLLVPCSSVHTYFMRFAIDVVSLDGNGRVLSVGSNIPPNRAVWLPRGTRAVLEVSSGVASIAVGDRLIAIAASGADLPASVRFLSQQL